MLDKENKKEIHKYIFLEIIQIMIKNLRDNKKMFQGDSNEANTP